MKSLFFIMTVLFATLLSGCLVQSHEPTPKLERALLTTANSQVIAEAIASLLHSNSVQLADDVFTQSSTVTLDRLNHKDPLGNPIMGKQLNMPDRFELLINDQQCYVRHLDSKATQLLKGISCRLNKQ
ncbi:hypothetical protein [Pseudoalteromonas mariniglutinosa]|uniref:hypothetical protein n=1 Tax=Pseudoalteromonas mariniglutinosa TaxID=206042 RepID=UPI0038512D14